MQTYSSHWQHHPQDHQDLHLIVEWHPLWEGRGGEGRRGIQEETIHNWLSLCADAGQTQGLPLVCPHDQQTHQERKESVKFSMSR